MTKNGRWKGSVQEDKDDNRTTVALKTDERAKTRAKNKEGTKAEPKVDEQKKVKLAARPRILFTD